MANNKKRYGICRNSSRHIEWAKQVRERDGECKKCGKKEYLHAHHIIPWNDSIEKRFDLANGITLCRSCHKKEEKDCPAGWNKGKSHSEEHRKNLSKALKGREVWNKGIKGLIVSPETQFKKGMIPWNKGKSSLPKERICKICGLLKKIELFSPLQKGKFYSHECKKCRNKRVRKE